MVIWSVCKYRLSGQPGAPDAGLLDDHAATWDQNIGDLLPHQTPPSSQPMAHPIPTYAQPHGTLAPGQTISVNKYTVQVERYLSQGKSNRDRPFRNAAAHQQQPNCRRLCSRLSRPDFSTSLWDNTSCSQEDRRRKRLDVDRGEEGG